MSVSYRTAKLDGCQVFYRVAGDPHTPALLLLHGFPTSSHMFRNLIPLLADRYHVIAPDLPGVVDGFTQAVGLKRYAIYVFDYGAPIGFRLALAHPGRITPSFRRTATPMRKA